MSQVLTFLPILGVFGFLIVGFVFWRKVGHRKFGSGALQDATIREIQDIPEEHVVWNRVTYSRCFGIAIFLGQVVGILAAVIFDKSILPCMIAGLIIPFVALWTFRPSSVR